MKNALTLSYTFQKAVAFMAVVVAFVLLGNVAHASKRVALVIGNSAYEHTVPLKNPRNDAEDLSAKLKSLGFEVVGGFDLDSRGMRDKVREFGNKLRGADVAMFFYAGHALQVNGRNYLAPVNTDIRHEGDLDFETIPMDFVQRQMERETKTVLLFLDACRDNPLARNLRKSSRSTGSVRGLARETESSEGTFIAFSTQPNNVALDGDGRNSPFTTALLANIDRPGVEISTLMTDVRRQVFETTNEQQIPWINSSLLGRFYFKGGEANVGNLVASLDERSGTQTDVSTPINPALSLTPSAPVKPVVKAQPVPQPVRENAKNSNSNNNNGTDKLLSMRLEQLAWEAVKDSKDVDELRAFVNAYGNGFFGDLAKLRLARIEKLSEVKTAKLDNSEASRKIHVEKSIRDNPEAESNLASANNAGENQPPQANQPPRIVTREVTKQIQGELNRIGCVAGRADGLWGKKSLRALGLFSKHAKLQLATLQPSYELLEQLQSYNQRICPVVKKVIRRQAKSCQPGQKLSRRGNCYWPRVKGVASCQPGQQVTRSGSCFWPGQQQQPGVFVQQQQPGVIMQQPGQPQVIVQQPQPQRRRSGLLGGAIGGIIGGVLLGCGVSNNC